MLKKKVHIKSVTFRKFGPAPVFNSDIMAVLDYRPGTKICLERAHLVTES